VPHAWGSWLAQADMLDLLPAQRLDAGPQYDLLSMALNGVIAGLGVALLPEYLAAGAVASGQVKQLSPKSWKAEKAYYLRYPEWKSEMMVLQRFQDWLKSA
jgi:LysR family glycine cleavage system transcriptional activator